MSRHLMLTLVAGGLAALGSAAAGARSPAYGFEASTPCGIGTVLCATTTQTKQYCQIPVPNIQGTLTCLRWKTVTVTVNYYYPPTQQPSSTTPGTGGSGGGNPPKELPTTITHQNCVFAK